MKNFSLKNFIGELIKGKDLYKKEQRLICIALLCFVVGGISFPAVKESIAPDDLPDSSEPEIIIDVPQQGEEDKPQDNIPSKPSKPAEPAKPDNTGATSGKIWVPPVYETVHHEAVYETKTVEMCITEGCGKYFDTPAEFQAHKAAEGG